MTSVVIGEQTNWTAGSYTAYNSPWGAASLVQGKDYSDTTTINSGSLTSGVVMNWSWPEIPASSGVYNFDQIAFGDYYNTVPQIAVAPSQINSIGNLSESFDFNIGGETSNFDVITDMFLTGSAGDNSTNKYEIEIFHHTPQYSSDWVNSLTQLGTFSGSGHTWKVAIGSGGSAAPDIVFMPTDTNDVLSGTLNVKDMLNYLVQQNVISATDYFNGLAAGVEVHQGSGSLTANSFSVSYNDATINSTSSPAVTLTDAVRYSNGQVLISGSAPAGSKVSLYDNGSAISTTIAPDSANDWSYKTQLSNQIHTFTVSAVDSAGVSSLGGHDLILGTTGADHLTDLSAGAIFLGGGGNDTFTGGGGNDTFVFHSGFGHDIITNFVLGISHDRLNFDHTISALNGIKNDADLSDYLLAHTQDTSSGALITLDHNDSILLNQIKAAQLASFDFHLI
ncbi:hypothetical protein ACRAWG_16320 [Methylobacterium sp. P31]